MKVGDLVQYSSFPRLGLVTKTEGNRVWFVDCTGYETFTMEWFLKVISEGR